MDKYHVCILDPFDGRVQDMMIVENPKPTRTSLNCRLLGAWDYVIKGDSFTFNKSVSENFAIVGVVKYYRINEENLTITDDRYILKMV